MRPIVTNGVAWSVCRSVGRSVTIVSPAEMVEPIEKPNEPCTTVDGDNIPQYEGAILRGKEAAHCKVPGLSAVSCAKKTA